MNWVDDYVFEDPFEDLRHDVRTSSALGAELARELATDHGLSRVTWQVVARALPQDDVVLRTDAGAALVHLTWSGHPEPPPFPHTTRFSSRHAFEDAVAYRY